MFKILVFASLIAAIVVWVLYSRKTPTDDRAKLREIRAAQRAAQRWSKGIEYLPSAVIIKLGLGSREVLYREKAKALEKELLASGYLTNALVTITNLPATATNKMLAFQEVRRRLRKLQGVEICHFYIISNVATVVCRPCDAAVVRDGLALP